VKIGKNTHIPALLALLLAGGAGASGLQGQEGFSYLYKIRGGLHTGDMQTSHFDNKLIGFGFEARREMPIFGSGVALTAELTYEYVPGRHHDNPKFPSLGLAPALSLDDRKEGGSGFNLRLAYLAPLNIPLVDGKLEWFAGLSLDRYKVRSEVNSTFNFRTFEFGYTQDNLTGLQNPPFGTYDGHQFVEEQTKLVPGVFAGIKYEINRDVVLELSLRNFGMWSMEFTPHTYSYGGTNNQIIQVSTTSGMMWIFDGLPPEEELGRGTMKTSTVRSTALEFAFCFRF